MEQNLQNGAKQAPAKIVAMKMAGHTGRQNAKASGDRKGRLVVIDRKPPMADNTTLMLYVVKLTAIDEGRPTAFFSLGTQETEIVGDARLAGRQAHRPRHGERRDVRRHRPRAAVGRRRGNRGRHQGRRRAPRDNHHRRHGLKQQGRHGDDSTGDHRCAGAVHHTGSGVALLQQEGR